MRVLVNKIRKKWIKLRLQPIRVFCFHQVSEVFDEDSMWECDWMSSMEFKSKVETLQREYTFISLLEAYNKLKMDKWRIEKYAVLTADDGSKTLENVLPWLEEKKIPVTLFINGSCLDGKTYRIFPTEKYFTKNEIMSLNHSMITIGHHGWEHKDIRDISIDEFKESIRLNKNILSDIPNVIPFFAYPYGTHSNKSDVIIEDNDLVPVYVDGLKNYNDTKAIHREIL